MVKLKKNEHGFGAIGVVLIIVIVGLVGVAGWLVYKNHKKTSTPTTSTVSTTTNANTKTPVSTSATTTVDPYAGWKTYTNSTYGINYKYPASWTTSGDVTLDATAINNSATKQEFSTGLKLTTDTKYNNTIDVEVLDENLSAASTWYDAYYAQSSLNQVTKKSEVLKGKQSVYYDITNSGNDSKLYLFSVGSKTYTFSSINEELNVQNAFDYWTTFQNVFNSLTLQ